MRTRNFADDVFFLAVFQLVPAAVKCSVLNARACSANAGRTGELGEYAGLDGEYAVQMQRSRKQRMSKQKE